MQLALLEMRVALRLLFERFPDLALATPPESLRRVRMPGWSRFESVPVVGSR